MRGYLFVAAGLCFSIAGGAGGLWWLTLLGIAQAMLGAVMVERDATREVDRLAKWTREDRAREWTPEEIMRQEG